jgi:DNA-binding transcriptional LysR family regulator
MTNVDWQLYQLFLTVMQQGSLSAAARQLRVSQPTLGRKMTELEEQLGISLFTRSQKGLAPTQDALRLLPLMESMAGSASALERRALQSAEHLSGVVRISASEVISAEVLPAILTDFCGHHPQVIIELVVTNSLSDLLRRDADIAVRMTRPTQEALLTRKIGESRLGLYARQSYLDGHGTPLTAADFAVHRVIGFDRRKPVVAGLPDFNSDIFCWRCDNDLVSLAALRAGFGVGVCQAAIAARDPQLVPLLQNEFRLNLSVWLAMHEELKRSPLMRATFDALAAGLASFVQEAETAIS